MAAYCDSVSFDGSPKGSGQSMFQALEPAEFAQRSADYLGGNSIPPELHEIAERLKNGQRVEPISVRALLSWFGAFRRGSWIVAKIRSDMGKLGIETVPDLESTYIDGSLTLGIASPVVDVSPEPLTKDSGVKEPLDDDDDPSYRVGRLESASKAPLCANRLDPLARAVTDMLFHDYSQLPVVTEDGILKVISWKSIGHRLALGRAVDRVSECLDEARVIDREASLFEAISVIVENDYVLVREGDNKLTGIVTAADLALEFRKMSEPYLLIGEIENHIRPLVAGGFSPEELVTPLSEVPQVCSSKFPTLSTPVCS